MASSIALNSSLNIDDTAETVTKDKKGLLGSLFNRAKKVGENLRNAKREDLQWMGANVIIGGAAAKLSAIGVGLGMGATITSGITAGVGYAMTVGATTLGLTAASATLAASVATVASVVAVGATSAAAAGLASGTVRALSAHIRERMNVEREAPRSFTEAIKQESKALFQIKDFKKQVLKSTKSAMFGAGLVGLFSGASAILEHTEIGRQIAGTAKEAFQKVAQNTSEYVSDFRKNLHTKLPFSSAIAQDLPKPMDKISDLMADAPAPVAAAPAPVADAAPKPMGRLNIVEDTPAPAPVVAAPVVNVAPKAMGKISDLMADTPVAHAPKPMAKIAVPAVEVPVDVAPKPMGKISDFTADVPAPAVEPVVETPIVDAAPKPMGKIVISVTDVPADVAPVAAKPAPEIVPVAPVAKAQVALSSTGQHPTLDGSIRERALAWARAMNPLAKEASVAPSVESAPVPVPVSVPAPTPVAAPVAPVVAPAHVAPSAPAVAPSNLSEQAAAVAKAKLALTQEELTNHYTLERLQGMVKTTTGIDAPADATAEMLAKQLNSSNPEGFLKGIQQQAPQMRPENVAVSCTSDIPRESKAVNNIRTLCSKFKSFMGSNDFAVVENINEPDPKKGLRFVLQSAMGGGTGKAAALDTDDFIRQNISGPNGVVKEMHDAALAP